MISKPTGYIVYRGPSLIDGSPIVAVALTSKRARNRKTGSMVQTYILRDGIAPLEALRSGADASVCGDCRHRPANGGACYVQVERGPTVVYKALQRGRYPVAGSTAHGGDVEDLGEGRPVRLGSYGDPMAVPARVWEALTARATGRTGYTHQWRNASIGADQRARVAALCMASVDDPREAEHASAQGLRYFRIRRADEALRPRELVCPASEEAGKARTCAECGACSGTRENGRGASVAIIVHGSKVRRYVAQRSA